MCGVGPTNEEIQKFMKEEHIRERTQARAGIIIFKEGNEKAERVAEEIKSRFKQYITRIEYSKNYGFSPVMEGRIPSLEIDLIYDQVDMAIIVERIIKRITNEGFNLITNKSYINQNKHIIQFEGPVNIGDVMERARIDKIIPETNKEREKRIKESDSYFQGIPTNTQFPKPSLKERFKNFRDNRKFKKMPKKGDFEKLEKDILQALEDEEGEKTTLYTALSTLNSGKEYFNLGDVENTIKYFEEAKNLFYESKKESDEKDRLLQKGYKNRLPFWQRGKHRYKLKEGIKSKPPLIPLLQFLAFLLGIYLLLFTPYWIFGLPLVIVGILLLLGVQSEREGLRELFHWFLTNETGHVWGMVLVVGIGSLIIGFSLGDWWIAAIPVLVIASYHFFGKKVVGDGKFIEYTVGLSGVTIILYYFFRSMPYIALIPVAIVFVFRLGGNKLGKYGIKSEHLTELIMTLTGIILFIGGTQYAASYLYITFSWLLLAGFGLFNTFVLVILWSMEEGGKGSELVKAQTDAAKANEAAAEEQKRLTEKKEEMMREEIRNLKGRNTEKPEPDYKSAGAGLQQMEGNTEKPKPNYESAGAGLQYMEENIAKPKKKAEETEK